MLFGYHERLLYFTRCLMWLQVRTVAGFRYWCLRIIHSHLSLWLLHLWTDWQRSAELSFIKEIFDLVSCWSQFLCEITYFIYSLRDTLKSTSCVG